MIYSFIALEKRAWCPYTRDSIRQVKLYIGNGIRTGDLQPVSLCLSRSLFHFCRCSNFPLSVAPFIYSHWSLLFQRASRMTKLLPPKVIMKLLRFPPLRFRRSGCVPGSPLKRCLSQDDEAGALYCFVFLSQFLDTLLMNRKLECAPIQNAEDSPARTSWHLKASLRII